MNLRPVPEITAEQENFRMEPLAVGENFRAMMGRRDPVEVVPVGTYVVKVFRVTGYDPDCDGSLMARLESVDKEGEATGWEVNCIGLYPDTSLIIDDPKELWGE